jgi:hypothetical protein
MTSSETRRHRRRWLGAVGAASILAGAGAAAPAAAQEDELRLKPSDLTGIVTNRDWAIVPGKAPTAGDR